MKIKDMFVKQINRDLNGVIKAEQNDEKIVDLELEEYVVTRELAKHFTNFFSNYKKGIKDTTDKIGVWISGFFGSGKSHLLKILSYLLANKEVEGKRAIDYFVNDNKIADQMVLANMKLAASVPTDVILFDIGAKSEIKATQSKDAIVSVMQNEFNRMQGYSASNPFLADLERKLDEDGKYEEFKFEFEKRFGSAWEDARSEFDFIQDDVVDVLSALKVMSEESARNWCEKAMGDYGYKVVDFAELVNKYIEKKGGDHHVIFLIDEVGQYIGDDSQLMLNMQSVTVELGNTCKGKAWIIVTSQEDIDSVTKTIREDFSKIQGRFDTRLSLSSANVDEVIRKRILKKTETARQTLESLYDSKESTLKNLLIFQSDIERKCYADKGYFAEIYPFVPYQFEMVGSTLTAIRTYGASGKHLADGERSMLAMFKDAAVKIMDDETGKIVAFHLFYDAIEQFIDHAHRIVITRALDNEQLNPSHEKECFNVNVLKTLFLVKYVDNFEANLENITTLMVSHIDDDRIDLQGKVKNALNRLMGQGLIQKNGDTYVFLTDEEQEINRAINAQNIDSSEVIAKVSGLIFDAIFPEKDFRCTQLGAQYRFPFNREVDAKPYSANQHNDITLKILTPNSDERGDEAQMKFISSRSNCVLVVLPDNRAFLDEIQAALRIEKFIRKDSSNAIAKSAKIKDAKERELRERNEMARVYLEEALNGADIYVNGSKLVKGSKTFTGRVNEAMDKLISNVYHKLTYIEVPKTESEILEILEDDGNQISLGGLNTDQNRLALDEVKNHIQKNTHNHTRTSMKTIMDTFRKAPYGFSEPDIEWLVAKLFKNGEISFFVNNAQITLFTKSPNEILRFLIRRENSEKLMTEARTKANEAQKKSVRDVMKELFRATPSSDDEDAIMQSFLGYAQDLSGKFDELDAEYTIQPSYPGRKIIASGKKLLNNLRLIKRSSDFFSEVDSKKDDYLHLAEEYDVIRNFFQGNQKKIFDEALANMKTYQDSKTYISDKDIEDVIHEIDAVIQAERPYLEIHKLPDLNERFNISYTDLFLSEKKPVEDAIEDARKRVFDELHGKRSQAKLGDKFVQLFDELLEKAETSDNLAKLRGIKAEADARKIRCLGEISAEEIEIANQEMTSHVSEKGLDDGGAASISPKEPKIKKQKTLSIKSINDATTWQLETEEDVKTHVAELEQKLMKTLEEDTIVNIEF